MLKLSVAHVFHPRRRKEVGKEKAKREALQIRKRCLNWNRTLLQGYNQSKIIHKPEDWTRKSNKRVAKRQNKAFLWENPRVGISVHINNHNKEF